VTSGRRLFVVDGDPLSAWGRRYRDLVADHASDLGGAEHLSAAQCSLVRRCAALEVELERMEARLSAGETVNLDLFSRLLGHLSRTLEKLGLDRRPRPVDAITPLEYAARLRDEAEK
jgi:hypothetical protein